MDGLEVRSSVTNDRFWPKAALPLATQRPDMPLSSPLEKVTIKSVIVAIQAENSVKVWISGACQEA